MRYFLKLSYNGTGFHGWQVQPKVLTVQEELAKVIGRTLQSTVEITGCGRTDTGVHAKEFYAHFDTESLPFPPTEMLYKWNNMLHRNIALHELLPVESTAHARFDATARSYEYLISSKKQPFMPDLHYYFTRPLDMHAMNEACESLIGKRSFASFCKANANNHTDICDVREASWREENGILRFRITADRFLRNMVRAVVGTMIDIGLKRTAPSDLEAILASEDRSAAGRSVPASGLYLVQVKYPSHIFSA